MDIYIVFYEAYSLTGEYLFKGYISQNYTSPVTDGDIFISNAETDAYSDATGKTIIVGKVEIVGIVKL